MSLRSLARRLAGHLTVGIVTAVAGGVIGAAITASGTVPLSQPSVVVPAPFDAQTVGVLRVEAVAPSADTDCGDKLPVVIQGAFGGDQASAAACVDPGVLATDRTTAVANTLSK